MKFIIALLIALLIFLALKLIGFLLKYLSYRFARMGFLHHLRVVLGFIAWLFFIFWAMDYLFRNEFFFPYLLSVLILLVVGFLGWYLLRDLFAGIVFRVKYSLKKGTHIRAGEISGIIQSQHLTCLKIITDDGQMLRVPYSRINHEMIIERVQPGVLKGTVVHLLVDSSLSKYQVETLIHDTILNLPWSSLKEEPAIRFLQENEKEHRVVVTFYTLSAKHARLIEAALVEIPSVRMKAG
ncbi:MAG TPA: mechanosensitive ion channel [Bacteroidales bacterium]|nr:mechanosensitive ion channel [Bacteroidales bacterium]HNS45988.1 mechanosensitive ion channel [Bacteroidales bacterium]